MMSLKHLLLTSFLIVLATMGNFVSAQSQKTSNPAFTEKINNTIDHSVPIITCSTLEQRKDDVVLLDAREVKEFKTSHIEGAQCIGYDKFSPTSLEGIDKDATIVIYCSIGYRSEKIGEQLLDLGYNKVYNLYGGIFEWNNTDKPMVDEDNQPTSKIHTYNKDWSKWVEKGDKVY